jgi:hypothetical protein
MILSFGVQTAHLPPLPDDGRTRLVVQTLGFPVCNAFFHVQQVGTTNQVFKLANTQLCHQFTYFFSNKEEVVHYVFRLTSEFAFAQFRILGGNTNRAGVEMAFTHHDAAFDHQRCGGETEFVSTQQGADHHVTTGFHLAVNLNANATAQDWFSTRRLLRFSQTQVPMANRRI